MNQFYTDALNRQLDTVCLNAGTQLPILNELPGSVQQDVVIVLLQRACQSQNVGHISTARKAISIVPRPCLDSVLESAIIKGLDLSDSWEYRRLLEVLKELNSSLFAKFIAQGLASNDLEVREAAEDLSKK